MALLRESVEYQEFKKMLLEEVHPELIRAYDKEQEEEEWAMANEDFLELWEAEKALKSVNLPLPSDNWKKSEDGTWPTEEWTKDQTIRPPMIEQAVDKKCIVEELLKQTREAVEENSFDWLVGDVNTEREYEKGSDVSYKHLLSSVHTGPELDGAVRIDKKETRGAQRGHLRMLWRNLRRRRVSRFGGSRV